MTNPEITVFMAAYNAEKYIKESINSILNQTYVDFELIILNDGSTDRTVEIVKSFSDSRIKLINNEINRGLFYTRNRIKDTARGKYIAILDSDDIAVKERLEVQYTYLYNNPKIALCGGHANVIDSNGLYTGINYIIPTDNTIKMFMLFGNPYINSTVMFKKEIFDKLEGYRNYAPAEDFDLFQRISENNEISNLDLTLVKYRIHDNNISFTADNNKKENELKILKNMHKNLNLNISEKKLAIHFELFSRNINPLNYNEYLVLLIDLKNANLFSKIYNIEEFNQFIFNKWYEILFSQKKNKRIIPLLFNKRIFSFKYISLKQFRRSIKLMIKSYF